MIVKASAIYAFMTFVFLLGALYVMTMPHGRLLFGVSRAVDASSETAWKEDIASKGGAAAYADLGYALRDATPAAQHRAAHAFGGALYDVEGVNGLPVCDTRFNFGCFHEFLGRAIASLGLDSVPALNEACMSALGRQGLSCQHGIGHGVMAAIGYDVADLAKALSVCDSLRSGDPVGGCPSGVFMEYNMRTMLGADAAIRAVQDDVYDPCDKFEGLHARACMYWAPQWWMSSLRSSGFAPESIVPVLGSRCEAYKRYLRDCFEGIGTIIAPLMGFDGHAIAAACDSASSDSSNRLYCRSLGANSLFTGGSGKTGDAEAVCEGLAEQASAYCLSYARNHVNVVFPEL